ncbi:hypothetical protein MAR_000204 [Mya arenaria]|uniref:Transposable element P transposase-like RNase H domain-containing protein n=1 Tax=Mya arenaria TaxID=6604 RepID=A0ABY7FC61_MYAAR|nr:hypothetical protein MAR_000204 [Mya arenaria]
MTFSSPDKENRNPSADDKDDDNIVRIKHLLKHANPELVSLFVEQSKDVSCDPRGRRWSKSFIGTCLELYNRSPHIYEILVSSKILEAKRRNLPDEEMTGGLIFDEMSIQSDLQISKNGDVVELVGFKDLGEEGHMCNTLRKGSGGRKLGTHNLKLLFLGITGFRFPFAHFITDNVQASELYGLFWKSVQYLKTCGFKVLHTCMDGAVKKVKYLTVLCSSLKIHHTLFQFSVTRDLILSQTDTLQQLISGVVARKGSFMNFIPDCGGGMIYRGLKFITRRPEDAVALDIATAS